MSKSLNSPNIFELKLEVKKICSWLLVRENTVFKRGEVNCFQDFGDVLPFPAIYWFPASPHNAESKMWNRKSYLIYLSHTFCVTTIFWTCIVWQMFVYLILVVKTFYRRFYPSTIFDLLKRITYIAVGQKCEQKLSKIFGLFSWGTVKKLWHMAIYLPENTLSKFWH